MGKRFVILLVGAAIMLAISAPAALADLAVTSVTPTNGIGGESVTCTVEGTYWVNTLFHDALDPAFKLVDGVTLTEIPGTTNSYSATTASVTFALPLNGPQARYDLSVSQSHKPSMAAIWSKDITTFDNAFGLWVRPAITSISPTGATVGSAAVTLTVAGQRFVTSPLIFGARSVVRFNGSDVSTTYNSSSQLTATIPADKLTAAGTAEIRVFNSPGSGMSGFAGVGSNALTFTISSPAPTMGTISPTSVWAGCVRTDIVLTVTGTSFVNGSRIVINGGEKTNTTFVSATQLTVPLTPSDMAAAVPTLMVTVRNPPFPPGTSSAGGLPITVQPETTTPTVTISGADDGWHNTPVALTFAASDSQSGIQKVQYMSAPTVPTWTDGTSYTVPTSTQGAVPVNVQALDWCNKVGTANATVNIDTTEPETEALNDPSVKKGKKAKLKYRITEPAGLSPTADVTIKIKRGNGTTAKTFRMNDVPVNTDRAKSFTCNLDKGKYTWSVYATDLAGNKQENIAKGKLTVK